MTAVRRILTNDGSHSLYLPELRETYHSTHGAMQESRHVFIKNGLDAWADRQDGQISILEVGLGTGLNALLTALWATENRIAVKMVSIEAYPLEESVWRSLNYADQAGHEFAGEWWEALHSGPWNEEFRVNEFFHLTKVHRKLKEFTWEQASFHLVYYDAFAPGKQADMWDPEALGKVIPCLKEGGFLVTYCAQGQFKRDLAALGMKVEPLAGPPGKKEMTRAVKNIS